MIELSAALKVIRRQRRVTVIITTMSAAREWLQLTLRPKDLACMGQGPPHGQKPL